MRQHDYSPADTLITDYCDNDSKWGPLLFLRPARSECFSIARCVMLASLPGTALGLLGSILFRIAAHQFERPALPIYVFPLLLTLSYFLICRFVIAPPWNRRAFLLTNRAE